MTSGGLRLSPLSCLVSLFQPHVAVGNFVIVLRPLAQGARAVDRRDAGDDVPGLAAVAACVHGERPAHGARYARQEFPTDESVQRREARDLGARDTRLRLDLA